MSSFSVSSAFVQTLRHLALAGLLLPLALPAQAGPSNSVLPAKVQQALKASKIDSSALSLVLLPMSGTAVPTIVNADVSVNPASTMKLVTT